MILRRTKIQLLVFALITLLGVSFVGAKYAQLDRLVRPTTYTVVAHFRDSGTLASQIRTFLRDGDLVLLKASRGVRLEAVASAIAAPRAAPRRRAAAS